MKVSMGKPVVRGVQWRLNTERFETVGRVAMTGAACSQGRSQGGGTTGCAK